MIKFTHVKKVRPFDILKKQKHSIENSGKSPLEIIEVQSGTHIAEEDIVRLKR